MSGTGLPAVDETVQLTNLWLKDLMNRVDWDDRQRAYRLLRSPLHALRDRLKPEETVKLGAQLSTLVRGACCAGWHPAGKLLKERKKQQFLGHVEKDSGTDPNADPEKLVRAVFALPAERMSRGEIQEVKHMLPDEVRDLWPCA